MKISRVIKLSFLWMASITGISTASYSASGARHLLVGSFSGHLTTLLFDPLNGALVRWHDAESYSPSWQTLFTSPSGKKYILSTNEGSDRENSGLTVWEVDKSGKLKFTSKTGTGAVITGPTNIAVRKDGLIVTAS